MSKILVLAFCLCCTFSAFSISDPIIVTFSSQRGYYDDSFFLSIASSDPKAVIKYSIDCSDPLSSKGKTYNTVLLIDSTTIVKAIAFTATDTSELVTHTYLFPEMIKKQPSNPAGFADTWGGSKTIPADYEMDQQIITDPAYSAQIVDALKSLPSLSLTMETDEWFSHETGLYVGYPNSNVTREKAVSAEFIYTDTDKSFLINCGVQNQGGTSIVNWKVPKQSMRLLFKSEYGPQKLKKEIFPDSEINNINTLVVDGFLYSWVHPFDDIQRNTTLYFRDQLASNIQNAMGGLSFHGIYVNVYINGLYWGVYDLHERPDEEFMSEYYDAEPEDFDVIKHNENNVVAGTNKLYKNLLAEARKGFATNESLTSIKDYLDLPAFIDYMILNFYLGNFDWAHQNYYAAVNKTLNTGYRFYTWDAEHVMRYSDVNYNNTDKNDSGSPTEIHQLLKQNQEYRLMFADAFYKHTFNNGALTPENFEKSFLKLKNEIDLAVILESARWGDYLESSTNKVYTKNDHWIPEVNKVLNYYIPNRLSKVLEQLRQSNNLLFPNVMPPVFDKNQGRVANGEVVSLSNTNSHAGDIFYTLDGSDPRKTGGDVQGQKYSSPIIIDQTTHIKARFRDADTKEWSALTEAHYIPDEIHKAIMISEVMYNFGYNDMEFVELLNNGPSNIDLKGYSFIDGIEYTFPDNLIVEPDNCVVLSNDRELFHDVYGFAPYDVFSKKLDNGGETLLVTNFLGEIIDSVSYSDNVPWPVEADGYGRSLELIDANADNAKSSNWRSSKEQFGSPGNYTHVSVQQTNSGYAELSIYPNPFTDGVFVRLKNSANITYSTIEIYNNYGQRVKAIKSMNTQNAHYIDLSELPAGVFILKVLGEQNNLLQQNKVIIKMN